METLFIPTEADFKRWVREAIGEYFEKFSLPAVAHSTKSQDELIGREEMAKILNISLVTLTDRVKKGLPSYKQGASVYFIREEVFDYMKRHNSTKGATTPSGN